MPRSRWPLQDLLRRLRKHYGPPSPLPSTDPFEQVLWESCAYLVDDERRARVYDRLVKATGAKPERIAAMQAGVLAQVIEEEGGMRPMMRAEKLQRAANLVLEWGQAELRRLCKTDPERARKLLKLFPGIGDPGADRLLMIAGGKRTLAPESNGLRVLCRLGFGALHARYEKTYASVVAATAPELPKTPEGLMQAHLLLRHHGKTLCKAGVPRCAKCPLAERCPSAV
jgi:endonuclease III